ncbi:MAG: response regulator transcription factor [Bacteroidetes bacterium]|nr:response regulator transcription factor [Bacteroidota bacterium]
MEAPLRYIIIDDNEIDRAVIESQAAKFPFLQKIISCSNPLEAVEFIKNISPDIIFLDIEMPGISGIDLLRKKIISNAIIVLISSHPEFALDGFELDVFDYILKPVTPDRFAACANRIRDFIRLRSKAFAFDSGQENNFIIIKQGYDKYKIALNDILFLESMKDYTRITTSDSEYLMLSTLSNMIEKLPGEKFVRIHRSFVVNKSKVTTVQKNKAIIRNHEIPIGKLYKHELNFTDDTFN